MKEFEDVAMTDKLSAKALQLLRRRAAHNPGANASFGLTTSQLQNFSAGRDLPDDQVIKLALKLLTRQERLQA
jgi:hypothetical protein